MVDARRTRELILAAVGAVLTLGSLGATPTPTPSPRVNPTPSLASATQTPTPAPTSAAPTATPSPRPIVMPDLAVAPVRWLPVGSAPLAAHAWTPSASLQAAVEAAVHRHQGSISVVATNLDTGATASVNADQQLSSASLYKLFLLHAAYARMASGELSAQEQLSLRQALADLDPYTDLPVGTRSSVTCALQTMIQISSNSAADLLEDRLGDSAVNAYLLGLGLQQSYITPDRAFTSAADIARLLNGIALGQAVSPLASSQMLTMLLAQQENNRLPLPLPVGIPIAHKTGELPNLRHDAGIIYAPSGAYLLVTLVANAPSDAAARDTIVDVSQTVYGVFGPAGAPQYLGLSPRVAQDVFQVPDAQGRLPVLLDPRTDSVLIGPLGVQQQSVDDDIRLRQETVPDLKALQQAASDAGVPFWVVAGLQPPNEGSVAKVLPTAFLAPCRMEAPPPPPLPLATATPAPSASPVSAPGASTPTPTATPSPVPIAPQAWLGTVIRVTDDPDHPGFTEDDTDNQTILWLRANGWQFGFVPAIPETDAGAAIGHEPWTFRWVGRPMAAQLEPLVDSSEYGAAARRVFERAETELASQAQAGLHDTTSAVVRP
jgi:beta-lactamase class A